MARKRPAKKSAKAGTAKTGAAKRAAKKPASKAAKARKAAKKPKTSAGKTTIPAAKKARAAKAARSAAAKTAAKRMSATKSPAAKAAGKKSRGATAKARAGAAKNAAGAARQPSPRRAAPRISAGRRSAARKVASREALAKKTLTKPAVAARKPAKKRPAKRASASKATGKTARSRLVVRASQKLAPPVLRDGARRRVVAPTAPRPDKPAAPVRTAPFRLHALGVRDEHPTDRPRIAALLTQAFGRPDEAAIVDRLRAGGDIVLSLIAEYEGDIVGHIAFSRIDAVIDGRAVKALGLAPLAVAPARQGRGVGSVLVASGLEAASAAGFDAVFVVGDAGYYARFGFSAPAAQPFESEWKPALLAIELNARALAGAAGSLVYPPALRG